VDADRLLIATFSRAAAAEMRGRIAARLSEMIRGEPSNIYLQRQQALLGSASIVTVHAFCSQLIRENFQHVAVAPDFEIMAEAELNILMDDAAAEVIEQAYGEADPVFFELVELLSTGRDDSRLRDAIYRIYGFARSHPFPERWLESRLRMYDPTIPVEQSLWGRALLRHASPPRLHECIRWRGAADLATGDDAHGRRPTCRLFLRFAAAKPRWRPCGAGRWEESVFLMKDFEVCAPWRGARGRSGENRC
jgi:ATP-dependent helicase/nuclease subunit A